MVRISPPRQQFTPKRVDSEPILSKFTVLIDTQERTGGWHFSGIRARSNRNYAPLIIRTEEQHLKTGDYSIRGLEHLLTVERKSLNDIYGTLAGGRARFEREHERMAAMVAAGGAACVVIEAASNLIEKDWGETIGSVPQEGSLNPNSVYGTWLSWSVRYNVPWYWLGSRRAAELFSFRFLESFWENNQDKIPDSEI